MSVYFIDLNVGWTVGYYGSILKTISGGITSISIRNPEIPASFSLSQNYPNPFNSMTNIKMNILNAGVAKLTVFDLLGRKVADIVNEYLQPGTYQVQFDASDLTSGIYFYQLKTDNFTETKKLLFIK